MGDASAYIWRGGGGHELHAPFNASSQRFAGHQLSHSSTSTPWVC